MSITIDIYVVCSGTSCNDIINSINRNKDTRHLKIKKQEIPLLDSIGVRQMYLAQQNMKVQNNIIQHPNALIFSTVDYDAIESALVFNHLKASNPIALLPLIITSKHTNDYIKNIKKLFGTGPETEKYWVEKSLNNQFANIKERVSQINWNFVDKLKSGNYSNFKNTIYDIIINHFRGITSNEYVFFCNYKLIIDILRNCKSRNVRYSAKNDIVENSSIWKFNITCGGNNITFNSFDKIYPTYHNYTPLKFSDSDKTFEYEFRGDRFLLYNPLNYLDHNFIKKLSFVRFTKQNRQLLKNINSKNNKKNENKIRNNTEEPEKKTFNNFLKI